jgi:hypothetical protein
MGYACGMAISKITFNGKRGGLPVAAEWIRALNDARLTTEKGGFLFKAAFDEDHLMLAAVPALIGDTRSYHYNLHLAQENAFTLIGDVNAQGVFTILFRPESREAATQHASKYIGSFRKLAAFLNDAGYAGEGRLDEVTQSVLKSLGIVSPPETLDALRQMEGITGSR